MNDVWLYIYKITNNINGKIYVGQHKFQFPYLDKKYFGGGVLLNEAYKKYGKENFSTELLQCCDTHDELNQCEIYWISQLNSTDNSIGYNILPGGTGGCVCVSDETRELSRERNINTTVVNDGSVAIKIDKTELDKYLCLGWNFGYLPYERTEQFKQKVSKTLSGYVGISKGGVKTKVSKDKLDQYLQDGYVLGWGTSNTQEPQHRIKGEKSRYMVDGCGNQLLVSESFYQQFLDSGWYFGHNYKKSSYEHKRGYHICEQGRKNLSDAHKGKHNSKQSIDKQREKMIGRVVIHDDRNNKKYIYKDQLQQYIDDGWSVGSPMVPNKRSKKVTCLETGETFESIADAYRAYPNSATIKRCINSDNPNIMSGGFHWYESNDIHKLCELLNFQYNKLLCDGKTQEEAILEIKENYPQAANVQDSLIIK